MPNAEPVYVEAEIDVNPLRPNNSYPISISVTRDFLPTSLTAALLTDALSLHSKGLFDPGGVGGRSSDKQNESIRQCDICGLFDDKISAVSNNARDELFLELGDLREFLNEELSLELLETMELQYLKYSDDGGFYGRHVDHNAETQNVEENCRAISLLIYLCDEASSEWKEEDGGYLRCYGKNNEQTEIAPHNSTLVLFNSKLLEHEVLPTHRDRVAIVGWFLSKNENYNQEEGRKKKKKKRRKN